MGIFEPLTSHVNSEHLINLMTLLIVAPSKNNIKKLKHKKLYLATIFKK